VPLGPEVITIDDGELNIVIHDTPSPPPRTTPPPPLPPPPE
jgi:hypothetical protein